MEYINPEVVVDVAIERIYSTDSLPRADAGLLYEACRAGLLWMYYYVFIHLLYYGVGSAGRMYIHLRCGATTPTLKVRGEEAQRQMLVSEMAFPLYCCVPVLSDVLRRHNFSKVCPTIEECGGPMRSLLNFSIYLFLVEAMVFWVHYWLLHKWPLGKRLLKHDIHHAYKHDHDMVKPAVPARQSHIGSSNY